MRKVPNTVFAIPNIKRSTKFIKLIFYQFQVWFWLSKGNIRISLRYHLVHWNVLKLIRIQNGPYQDIIFHWHLGTEVHWKLVIWLLSHYENQSYSWWSPTISHFIYRPKICFRHTIYHATKTSISFRNRMVIWKSNSCNLFKFFSSWVYSVDRTRMDHPPLGSKLEPIIWSRQISMHHESTCYCLSVKHFPVKRWTKY